MIVLISDEVEGEFNVKTLSTENIIYEDMS